MFLYEAMNKIKKESKELSEANAEEFVKDIEIMKRMGLWDGRDETYQAAKKKLNDIREITKDQNKSVDLNEEKSLTEDRYYYGEIDLVKNAINSNLKWIGKIHEALKEAFYGNNEDYTQEMIDVLGEVDVYFDGVEKKCDEILNKLSETFPCRIRRMTPEEKEEIQRRIKNGEM